MCVCVWGGGVGNGRNDLSGKIVIAVQEERLLAWAQMVRVAGETMGGFRMWFEGRVDPPC